MKEEIKKALESVFDNNDNWYYSKRQKTDVFDIGKALPYMVEAVAKVISSNPPVSPNEIILPSDREIEIETELSKIPLRIMTLQESKIEENGARWMRDKIKAQLTRQNNEVALPSEEINQEAKRIFGLLNKEIPRGIGDLQQAFEMGATWMFNKRGNGG